jgi:hypothetical protein
MIRAIRKVVDALSAELTLVTASDPLVTQELSDEIKRLINSLRPLFECEDQLATEISGGLSGRAAGFVRAGWQTLVQRSSNPNGIFRASSEANIIASEATIRAAEIFWKLKGEIKALWENPLTLDLRNDRRLRLEESAPL